jgi:plasmid stabilization system protein ParE
MAGTYQVVVTPAARQDFADILEYAAEQQSDQRAATVQDEILAAIDRLEEMPTAHAPVRETYELVGEAFRRIVADKYRIIFTVEEADRQVFVIRIIHIKRGPGFVREALL